MCDDSTATPAATDRAGSQQPRYRTSLRRRLVILVVVLYVLFPVLTYKRSGQKPAPTAPRCGCQQKRSESALFVVIFVLIRQLVFLTSFAHKPQSKEPATAAALCSARQEKRSETVLVFIVVLIVENIAVTMLSEEYRT